MGKITRRDFLKVAGATTLGVGALVLGEGLTHPLFAGENYQEEKFADAVKRIFEGKMIKTDGVVLEAPTIAETGATVPISVAIDSPMTEGDHIKSLYVFVEKNPAPLVAKFSLSPANGKAFIETRIKMAKTSNVYAIGETNKGELIQAVREVKVTLGGCGG